MVYVIMIKYCERLHKLRVFPKANLPITITQLERKIRDLWNIPATAELVLTYKNTTNNDIKLEEDGDVRDAFVRHPLSPLLVRVALVESSNKVALVGSSSSPLAGFSSRISLAGTSCDVNLMDLSSSPAKMHGHVKKKRKMKTLKEVHLQIFEALGSIKGETSPTHSRHDLPVISAFTSEVSNRKTANYSPNSELEFSLSSPALQSGKPTASSLRGEEGIVISSGGGRGTVSSFGGRVGPTSSSGREPELRTWATPLLAAIELLEASSSGPEEEDRTWVTRLLEAKEFLEAKES